MLLALRHPRLWLAIGWMLVVAAVLLSILPAQSLPRTPTGSDKIAHAAIYALLALWFAGIYPRSRYLFIAAGLLSMGIGIEWLQGAMRLGRQSDFNDVIANALGIGAGLALALVWLGGWAQRLEVWARRP